MALINWQWQNPDVINDQRNAVAANKEAMDYNQTAALNKIYSQNIDAAGNLDNSSFYRQASSAGLSPDRIRAAADLFNQQQETNKNTATTDTLNRMFGYNPVSGGRNNAQIGNTASNDQTPTISLAASPRSTTIPQKTILDASGKVIIPPEPGFASIGAGGNQIPLQTRTSPAYDAQGNQVGVAGAAPYLPGNTPIEVVNPLNTQGVRADEVSSPNLSNDVANQDNQQFLDMMANYNQGQVGNINGQVASEDNPYNLGNGSITARIPTESDNRSWFQKFQDSWNESKSPLAQINALTGTQESQTPPDDLFKWDVKDDGSDQYRQYKQAQTSYLGSKGYSDSGAYLKDVYANALLENAAPGINPMLIFKDPKNPGAGLSEIGNQIIAKAQQDKVAEGKARQAVLSVKSELSSIADKYGVQNVEDQTNRLSGDMKLYDKADREKAVILLQNRDAINEEREKLNNAGSDLTSVLMNIPTVAKVAGMAYGSQPTEFNIQEVYKAAYPELDKNTLTKIALGTVAAFKSGDWKGVTSILNNIDSADPKLVKARLHDMLDVAQKTTEKGVGNYIIGAGQVKYKERAKDDSTTSTPTVPSRVPSTTPAASHRTPGKVNKKGPTKRDPLGLGI